MTQLHNSQFTIHNSLLKNANTYFTTHFVASLAQSGLKHAVIAPGSRSTPLTLAFAAHDAIQVHLHLDERGAGFFALGLALALDAPAALVCTSGTAVANFLPAIVEARMSHVPLLLLTADRPPELRGSGANQTIDQVKIYGDQVLWSVKMPLPTPDPPDQLLRHIHTLAARAYAAADGLVKGPVHLNFPFRKPLQPEGGEDAKKRSSHFPLRIQQGQMILTRTQEQELADLIRQHERGLIICGPRCPSGNFPPAVAGLSQMSGYPILADPLSGVRWGHHANSTIIVGGYETFMQGELDWPEPAIILRFGAVPTSKWLNAYLDRIQPAARLHIRGNGVWADASHRVTHFIQADAETACYQIAQSLPPRLRSDWLDTVSQTETAVWQILSQHLYDPYFDGAVVADLVELMPRNANLFVGNSLPVRHLDQFGRPSPQFFRVFGNRGASGIDGNLSTGLGIAAARQQPTALLVGDITFLHDLNSLHQVAMRKGKASLAPTITIVLLNNNGGNIFRRLPISQIDPPFTDLFLTPHGLELEPAVRMFGLDYVRADDRDSFRAAFAASMADATPGVIEVRTDGALDEQRRRELERIVKNELKMEN